MGGNMGGEETTDGAGRFVVERVTPGSYQVMTQPTMEEISEVFEDGDREPGFADFMTLVETVSVDIADGETVEVVLGAPPAAPVVVSGRVLDGDQPITTGSVLAVADGRFDDALTLLSTECFPTFGRGRDVLLSLWRASVTGKVAVANGRALTPAEAHRARKATPVPRNIGCPYATLYCENYW